MYTVEYTEPGCEHWPHYINARLFLKRTDSSVQIIDTFDTFDAGMLAQNLRWDEHARPLFSIIQVQVWCSLHGWTEEVGIEECSLCEEERERAYYYSLPV